MTLTVGIDVVTVERIRSAANTDMYGDLFTPAEIGECVSQPKSHARLAACFAVKEAFLKASGLGLNSGFLFKDIEVTNQGSAAPELKVGCRAGELMREAGDVRCLVSSSFTDTLACAVVTLERKGTE